MRSRAALFLRSPVFWCFVLLSSLYILAAHYISLNFLGESLRVLQMTLSAAVAWAYAPFALRCFVRRGWPEREELIALGIFISWSSVFLNGSWALVYRLSGQPSWMINNDFYTSWIALNSMAAMLHIIAPNLVGAGVPRADKLRLGAAWIAAGVIIVMLAVYRPDLSVLADALQPYLDERGSVPWSSGTPPTDFGD